MFKGKLSQVSGEELKHIVDTSTTISEALKKTGLEHKGSNYKTLERHCQKHNIDLQPLKQRSKEYLQSSDFLNKKQPSLEDILIENSSYSRGSLKRRLLQENLLQNLCYICGLKPEWNSQPLVLVLDHINGINNDDRLENLRLICPNCNSQTPTFAGRSSRRVKQLKQRYNKQPTGTCLICPSPVYGAKYCSPSCASKARRKCERPTKEVLQQELETSNLLQLGKKYGVSDNAVRKWAKQYGII